MFDVGLFDAESCGSATESHACSTVRPISKRMLRVSTGVDTPSAHTQHTQRPQAVKIVFDEKHDDWQLEAKFAQSWVDAMAQRIANMLRHTKQGELKSPKAQWVRSLPWRLAPQVLHVTEYTYGWDEELQQAYRRSSGSGKEFAVSLSKPANGTPLDPIVAKWPDGDEHAVADVTCELFDELQKGRGGARHCANDVWEGQHAVTITRNMQR